MSILPNKLSFIWVGKIIPLEHTVTILTWMMHNPLYQCYLWTEAKDIDDTVKQAIEAYQELPEGMEFERAVVEDDFSGKIIHFFRRHWTPRTLRVFAITALQAISDPIIMYEEMDAWRNYGAVSDIARIWVLYEIGGIYMDIDTFSNGKRMPCNIVAPKDILFGLITQGGETAICNHIIASAPDNPQLVSLCQSMDRSYEDELPLQTQGARKYTAEAMDRYMLVDRARVRIPQIREDQPNEKRVWRLELFRQLGIKTINRTGPAKIREWIADIEGDLGTDLDTDERRVLDSVTVHLYGFQTQANYEPIVKSLTTWVK